MTTVSEDLGLTTPTETASAGTSESGAVTEPGSVSQPVSEAGDATTEDIQVVEAPAIDMAQLGDQLVSVKVGGEEQWVPLSEAVSGYQRQADYTRKTQEVAAEKSANEQAIQIGQAYIANPEFTVKYLAEQRGLSIGNGSSSEGESEYRTPEEQAAFETSARIEQLESQLQASQAQSQLDRDFVALESKVGEFDRAAVEAHMHKTGVYNPEMVWTHLNMDAAVNGRAANANQAAKNAVLADKRDAQVVHKPSPNASKTSTATASERPQTLREAALMADNGVEVPTSMALPDWMTNR